MEVDCQNIRIPIEENKVSDKQANSTATEIQIKLDTSIKPPNPKENFIKAMLEVIIF
jgi:hypothetical protein